MQGTHSKEIGYDRVIVHICQISKSLHLNLSTFTGSLDGHSLNWQKLSWEGKMQNERQFRHFWEMLGLYKTFVKKYPFSSTKYATLGDQTKISTPLF